MPTYLYSDGDHEKEVVHGMLADPLVFCEVCNKPMHRKPQMPNVNWNGLPPSQANDNPIIREMIEGAPQRRDEYAKLKATRS